MTRDCRFDACCPCIESSSEHIGRRKLRRRTRMDIPESIHSCAVKPLHCFCTGAHSPMQTPSPMQVCPIHGPMSSNTSSLQRKTLLPMQRVSPSTQFLDPPDPFGSLPPVAQPTIKPTTADTTPTPKAHFIESSLSLSRSVTRIEAYDAFQHALPKSCSYSISYHAHPHHSALRNL
jgi:hypothetical protein